MISTLSTVSPETIDASSEEQEMIWALRNGVPAAYEEFVETFGGQMLAVARRFLRCEQDAADAVQDAFLSAFQSIDTFVGGSRLSTWLHRIVVNASLMKLRSKSRRHEVRVEEDTPLFDKDGRHARAVPDWDPHFRAESEDLKEQVRRCIDELPESYREILMLRDIEERGTEETANLLGETVGNVKTRLHRARHALRARIEMVVF